MTTARALLDLRHDLLPRRGPSRLLGLVAVGWLASALFHLAVFVADDRAWGGSLSWRKPIVFSASIGLLLWTYGWVLDRLPDRRRLAWGLAGGFAAACTAETALIALQTWRGRASHFNTAEAGDAAIFVAMGVLVGIMSLLLVTLFVWSLISRPTDRLERTAALAGMLLVLSGLGFGQWIIELGNDYVERFDRVPETVLNGEAGVAKFPHAVAFHGIQVFMVAAALLRRAGLSTEHAQRLLRRIVASYVGVLVFAALQSFGGRAPLDLDVVSGVLLAISLAVLLAAGATVVRSWARARTTPAPPVMLSA